MEESIPEVVFNPQLENDLVIVRKIVSIGTGIDRKSVV